MADDDLYAEPGGEEFTGGWSGSETSHERALREEEDGTAPRRRDLVVAALRLSGYEGMTCFEMEQHLDEGHGAVSGALSNLHKMRQVTRLTERRRKQEIYILPEFVNSRETVDHRPNSDGGGALAVRRLLERSRLNGDSFVEIEEVEKALNGRSG